MRHRNDSENFIYLPVGENYVSIYNKFKDYFYIEHDENEKVISYDTFRRLWIEILNFNHQDLIFVRSVKLLENKCKFLKVILMNSKKLN